MCLISFNREVTILGDGNSPLEVIAGDKLMNQAQLQVLSFIPCPRFVWFVSIKYSNTCYIQAIGAAYELNAEINVSKDKLLDKLYTLEEDGPTALGMSIVLL